MDYRDGDGDDDDSSAGYLGTIEQREREELEFYTDLAVQEMQRWIESVTRKQFKFPDDPKASLADGILLCELLNGIKPGTVKRINRLPTPMAGMDNLNVFIDASKRHFGLKQAQLFTPTDLQDFADRSRDIELTPDQLKKTEDKKIRNHQYSSSGDWTEPDSTHYRHSRTSSRDSTEVMLRRASAPGRREGRYSSSDSLDDLNRPNSQNSDRSELRRTSATVLPSNNPLQFIALKPAVDLAQKAEKQLELVQETKKKRESVDKDETEWQTNLSSWKQRRKSKSSNLIPEREANELQTEKYQNFERSHRDGEGSHYSQSQSSQSYDDEEAFYSPSNHQKSSSETSSPGDDETHGGTEEFKPFIDVTESGHRPILDIIERATIKPVESQPFQSANLKSSGSMQPSMGKNKMRVKLVTEVGSDDGFGFTIKGGKDKCLPITIESITNDSAADKAELLEGDEVLEINDEVVSDRNRGYCMLLVNGSLQKSGKLEMFIKRDYTKVPNAAKERKQSSHAAPKSILDIYDSMASKSDGDSEDVADGSMLSVRDKDIEKIEDDRTRREMEREYRQILDGGYDSAVSTLRSEITMEDRQAYVDSQEKISPSTVHASYMSPPSENTPPPDYEEERESASVESYTPDQPPHTSSENYIHGQGQDSDEEGSMETFEQIHDKVTKDFEEVAPSLVSKNPRLEKRSKQMDEDDRRRMEEWQRQQDARQQDSSELIGEEQYEKEQGEIQRQIEKSRQEAEDYERNRKNLDEAPPVSADEASSTLSSLRVGISTAKEIETRDKAVQRLLEIKARYSRDSQQGSDFAKTSPSQTEPIKQEEAESSEGDDPYAEYRINRTNNNKESESEDMRDRYTANYFDYKPTDNGSSGLKETPYLSDVYKYYDEDLPSNLGERDPTPPPMSRKDVMNMNKKSTPWRDAKDLPPDADRSWERRDIIASVDVKVAQPWRRPEVKPQEDRRKSAPVRSHWKNEAHEELQNSQSNPDKQTDIDPNLPRTLRKEDVLKMTREKARFSAQSRRASEVAPKSQPINHKKMNAVPVPIRKSITDWVKVQSESDSSQDETDQSLTKPQHRNSMGFFSNRAMFEQQSAEADRYWADQSKESQKQPAKHKPAPIRKAVSTAHAPHFKKETRSKSVDHRPQLNRGDIVRSVDASDAAYERMKELAQMKQLREAEAAKAEEDERERRNRERKMRDERQRELAEIRKMNQQYEAAHIESTQQQGQQDSARQNSRSDELERARQRMAREAEELAHAQMRHDADVKTIHGVDMREERRRRDLENSRPAYGDEDDQRHTRELGDLDRDGQMDAMAKRRHQELVEQSRRDQMRREEARQIQQRRPPQQQWSQSQKQNSQRLHPQSQQQQQQEWRPQQQPPPQQQRYPAESQPLYAKPNTDNNARYSRLSSPPHESPRNSNQNISAKENGRGYNDNYANGYGFRESSSKPDSTIYQTPRLNSISQPIRVEGGNRSTYNAPQEVRGDIEPQTQSVQRTAPPYGSNERKAPKSYERQQPIGNVANHIHQDSYERDIPPQKPTDRPSNDQRRQDTSDRNMHPGYSSSNDGYNDSHRSHPSEHGRVPSYTSPDSLSSKSKNEEPRYAHSFQNGGSTNLHNNNDIYKRDIYSREKSPETSLAPSKPPRGMQNLKSSPGEEDMVTVSAKYSCAYCSKELGKGAAMVIESLGLYYHVECFRCCVCHSLLSNGQMGADVRVRGNRLHCKNCYSNDDAGIKYSAV